MKSKANVIAAGAVLVVCVALSMFLSGRYMRIYKRAYDEIDNMRSLAFNMTVSATLPTEDGTTRSYFSNSSVAYEKQDGVYKNFLIESDVDAAGTQLNMLTACVNGKYYVDSGTDRYMSSISEDNQKDILKDQTVLPYINIEWFSDVSGKRTGNIYTVEYSGVSSSGLTALGEIFIYLQNELFPGSAPIGAYGSFTVDAEGRIIRQNISFESADASGEVALFHITFYLGQDAYENTSAIEIQGKENYRDVGDAVALEQLSRCLNVFINQKSGKFTVQNSGRVQGEIDYSFSSTNIVDYSFIKNTGPVFMVDETRAQTVNTETISTNIKYRYENGKLYSESEQSNAVDNIDDVKSKEIIIALMQNIYIDSAFIDSVSCTEQDGATVYRYRFIQEYLELAAASAAEEFGFLSADISNVNATTGEESHVTIDADGNILSANSDILFDFDYFGNGFEAVLNVKYLRE